MGKIGKVLGSISPLYGAISGEGAFGNALRGVSPVAMAIDAAKDKKKKPAGAPDTGEGPGMKRGGRVSKGGASSRADGIARKGKTRGKFV